MTTTIPRDGLPVPSLSDASEMRRAYQLLYEPGQVVELRSLHVSTPEYRRPHVVSGYFDVPERLIEESVKLSGHAAGVYWTVQKINPALLGRAYNRVRHIDGADPTTNDKDVLAYRWFLMDCDAQRPAGVSANDTEREAAAATAKMARDYLMAEGWPEPLVMNSGNGEHNLWFMDLPLTVQPLFKQALAALAFQFDSKEVSIDQTVYNGSRIWKTYGSLAAKGESIPGRPHRIAHIVSVPDQIVSITQEMLERLAATLPVPPVVPKSQFNGNVAPFDLERWLADHSVPVQGPREWSGGKKWIFGECPFEPSHTNRSAFILQFPNGAVDAGCRHNSCSGKGWADLRAMYEPGYRDRKAPPAPIAPNPYLEEMPIAPPARVESKAAVSPLRLTLLRDFLQEPPQKIKWTIEDTCPGGGTSLMVAKPKVGKSTTARTIAVCVSTGRPFLDRATQQGPVIYLALEEKRDELRAQFDRMTSGDEPIHLYTGGAPERALEALAGAIREHNAVLAIVDPLLKMMRVKDLNDYAEVNKALEPLHLLARETGCHIMLVHHESKGAALREAGDGILGSTALFGGVDTAIIMRKRDNERTIESSQRYGKDIEKTVLHLDPVTGFITAAGKVADVEQKAVEDAIKDYLKTIPGEAPGVEEKDIREHVEGQTKKLAVALRALVDRNEVSRSGQGHRGNPFLYKLKGSENTNINSRSLVPTIYREQEKQETPKPIQQSMDAHILVPEKSAIPTASQSDGNENPDLNCPVCGKVFDHVREDGRPLCNEHGVW